MPNLSSKLNEALFGASEVIIDLGEDITVEEVIQIKETSFESATEMQHYLSEGALLHVNKLLASSLLIPAGQYMIWAEPASTTILHPVAMSNESEVTGAPESYEILTSKLIDNWSQAQKFLSEDGKLKGSSTSTFKSKHPGRIHPIDSNVAAPIEASGKSQEEIADELGVNPSTVSRWMTNSEKSGRSPTLAHAGAIASIVGAEPGSMFKELDTANSATKRSPRRKTGGSGGGRNAKIAGNQGSMREGINEMFDDSAMEPGDDYEGAISIADLANQLGVPINMLILKIKELSDAGKLVSAVWDDIEPQQDLNIKDLPTIEAALGLNR